MKAHLFFKCFAVALVVASPAIAWAAFKEGMPFLVSQPPDYDLPEYARPLALRYREWEQRVGRGNVWKAIQDL